MAKAKTRYVCQSCGYESLRWQGQCGGCREWNTLVEEAKPQAVKTSVKQSASGSAGGGRIRGAYGDVRPQRLSDVSMSERPRLVSGVGELDRVLGGGAMLGGLTLVAGEPGIGKSTLMTELGRRFGAKGESVLYVTGEESA